MLFASDRKDGVRVLSGVLLAASIVWTAPSSAQAAVITADCELNGPGDLVSAIGGANEGDVVNFTGFCDNSGEPIEIAIDRLTLDGGGAGEVFDQIVVIGADNVVLQDFVVFHSGTAGFGVGIESRRSSVEVRNVIVTLDYPNAVGFFANQNGTLVVSDSEAWLADSAGGFCNSNAASANAGSVLISEGGNLFVSETNTGVCASNGSHYRQNAPGDTIEAPIPVGVADDSMADIRGADINADFGPGDLRLLRNAVLRVRGSDLGGSSVLAEILSSCEIRSDGTAATAGSVGADKTSVCELSRPGPAGGPGGPGGPGGGG